MPEGGPSAGLNCRAFGVKSAGAAGRAQDLRRAFAELARPCSGRCP